MNKADSIETDEITSILEQLQKLSIPENSDVIERKKSFSSSAPDNTPKKQKINQNILYISLCVLAVCVSAVVGYITFNLSSTTVVTKVEPQQKIVTSKAPEQKIVKSSINPPRPALPERIISPGTERIIVESRNLIQKGKIISARKLLLNETVKARHVAEIPFILAQTYDPNFLKTLPSYDADAELNEARKWYREWYTTARKSESPPSPEKLEQLLRPLR